MRILLLGEYSNVHHTLAEGLKTLGHEVLLVSNGDFWKNYPRDIDVSRRPGRLGGLMLASKLLRLLPRMRGFDVVQLINPMFVELKAERIFPLYRFLRRHNRHMVLGSYGMDYYWVKVHTDEKPLRYSDFNVGSKVRHDEVAERDRRDWLNTEKGRLNQLIAHDCDAIVTGLYEYQVTYQPLFPQKTRFIPFPIAPATVTTATPPGSDISTGGSQQTPASAATEREARPIRVFAGISKGRSVYKGTDIMLKAALDVAAKYPERMEVQVAEGIPFDQYQHMMDGSDVILDQLYSYTPAMNALLAMQKGIVVVGGGEPENYEILNERELRPIINVQPCYESVYHELEQLALSPQRLARLKDESRQYVSRHHDYIKVAQQYQSLYEELTTGHHAATVL